MDSSLKNMTCLFQTSMILQMMPVFMTKRVPLPLSPRLVENRTYDEHQLHGSLALVLLIMLPICRCHSLKSTTGLRSLEIKKGNLSGSRRPSTTRSKCAEFGLHAGTRWVLLTWQDSYYYWTFSNPGGSNKEKKKEASWDSLSSPGSENAKKGQRQRKAKLRRWS